MAQVKEQSGTTWMVLEASLLIWARYCCAVLSSCCLPNIETNMSPRLSLVLEKKNHLSIISEAGEVGRTPALAPGWHGIRS